MGTYIHRELVIDGYLYSVRTPLKWTPLGPLLCVREVIYNSGDFGILPVGVVMCSRAVEHDWGHIFYLCCRIMKKQRDNIMP